MIQYRETDWEFLKRMASWCGGVVVPETKILSKPSLGRTASAVGWRLWVWARS